MDLTALVILAVIILLILYTIFIYNGLVTLKHSVSKAWSNIDVLLKQRHDELPKLVDVCKQYMSYERDTLEKVIRARSAVMDARTAGNVGALGEAESQLRLGLGNLFALAENYPELKANQNFQQLQSRISQLENSIADRREVYNESVNLNNVRIEQFPDVIIARMFAFKSFDLLRFSEQEKQDVNIKSLFAG
jgi:LemA protein